MKRQAREVYGTVPRRQLRTVSAPRIARYILVAAVIVFAGVLTWAK